MNLQTYSYIIDEFKRFTHLILVKRYNAVALSETFY